MFNSLIEFVSDFLCRNASQACQVHRTHCDGEGKQCWAGMWRRQSHIGQRRPPGSMAPDQILWETMPSEASSQLRTLQSVLQRGHESQNRDGFAHKPNRSLPRLQLKFAHCIVTMICRFVNPLIKQIFVRTLHWEVFIDSLWSVKEWKQRLQSYFILIMRDCNKCVVIFVLRNLTFDIFFFVAIAPVTFLFYYLTLQSFNQNKENIKLDPTEFLFFPLLNSQVI